MRRGAVVVGLAFVLASSSVVTAEMGAVRWDKLNVATHLFNDGRVEVVETHEVSLTGDLQYITRDLNFGADQSAVVHGVFRVEADGSRLPLKDTEDKIADAYQAYRWGVHISVRGEKDPEFPADTARRYLIEYTLEGAVTPAWDLAAGPVALGLETSPQNPLIRAQQVWTAWREAWPDIDRKYRIDHDVAFPSMGSGSSLGELNYRFEYDDSWQLLDKDRDIGVAHPEVDYRVQRVLRYLPEGVPAGVDTTNAMYRLLSLVGPLLASAMLLILFLAANRFGAPAPRGDRALFERRIGSAPPELIAAMSGWNSRTPSFETFLLRLAARKKLSITLDSPETDDECAKVTLRLIGDRSKLHPVEKRVIDGVFKGSDTITTDGIQARHKGETFDPHAILGAAFAEARPTRVMRKRPLLAALHIAMMGCGIVLMVRSLLDHTLADPFPIVGTILPGYLLASVWPAGSTTRRASLLTMSLAAVALGLLATALALTPNTPFSGAASLGLAVLGTGHFIGYLARVPKPSADDLEFDAARRWGLAELKKPRPALLDAWVESIDAMGGERALAAWRKRYAGTALAPADFSEASLGEVQSGPPFTGEPLPHPTLEPDWSEGFGVYNEEDDD